MGLSVTLPQILAFGSNLDKYFLNNGEICRGNVISTAAVFLLVFSFTGTILASRNLCFEV
jgi:hypothetical protein